MTHADAIEMVASALRRSSHNYHARAVSDRRYLGVNTNHVGSSWYRCPAIECMDNVQVLKAVEPFTRMSVKELQKREKRVNWAKLQRQRRSRNG